MAGDTSAVCLKTLRVQWDSHSSYAAICTHWTITKDQLIRLRDVVPLKLRIDRRLRFKNAQYENPSQAEEEASASGLGLAPLVAQRATVFSSQWSDETRRLRQVTKSGPVTLATFRVPDSGGQENDDTE